MPVTSIAWDPSSRSFGRSAMICSTTRGFIRKHLIHLFTAFITVFLPPIGQYWDRIMPSNARGPVCRLRSWKWVMMAIVTEWLRGNIIGWRPLKSSEEFLSRPSTLRSPNWSMNGERDASELEVRRNFSSQVTSDDFATYWKFLHLQKFGEQCVQGRVKRVENSRGKGENLIWPWSRHGFC